MIIADSPADLYTACFQAEAQLRGILNTRVAIPRQLLARLRALAVPAGLTLSYIWLFLLIYPSSKGGAVPISVLPVLVAGWMLGRYGGLISGICLNIITIVLFQIVDNNFSLALLLYQGLPTILIVPTAGYIVGLLRDLIRKTQTYAQALDQERAQLQSEVAARQRVEAELLIAKDAAEAASRAQNALLSSMSHELRTPLTAIMGYSELLRAHAEDQDNAECVSDVDRILIASRQLLGMINSVLDVSNIESGKLKIEAAPFDLRTLIDELATAIQPTLLAHQNTLSITIAPAITTLHADRAKVRTIIFTLLNNAVKCTKQGQIALAATVVGRDGNDWAAISVSDTSAGLGPEALPQLFQEVAQAANQHSRSALLGLAISRRLCLLMGGDIRVDSRPGHGATFTVDLPLVAQRL